MDLKGGVPGWSKGFEAERWGMGPETGRPGQVPQGRKDHIRAFGLHPMELGRTFGRGVTGLDVHFRKSSLAAEWRIG